MSQERTLLQDGTHIINVATSSRSYEVIVGAGLLESLGERIAELASSDIVFVVSDTNVAPRYLDRVFASLASVGFATGSVVVEAGERHKTLATYGRILTAMAEAELTRSSLVVALGGGVVGDMAGFAAATYMRGIRVVQVPTTLLSMVDSSVGGKTAIDLEGCGKNLVGAFLQPSLVLADVETLRTLEPDVFVDGIGEVVKHAVLADPTLFDELCARPLKQDEDPAYLAQVVARNVAIKRDVVATDERELGLRQTLNLGHTLGHAIEAASGYRLGHGHCVAVGLCCIARAAERLGWADSGLSDAIASCTRAQGLPTTTDLAPNVIFTQATHDKKRHGTTVNVVVPERIGSVSLRTISLDELRTLTELGCGHVGSEG